jgi:sugar O-acyltransferase (sialic acid O-acetyltransferase NeuD family)
MTLFGVYGCSGFGREVMPMLRQQLAHMTQPHEMVFVDDGQNAPADLNGHRVLSWADFLEEPASDRQMTLAIGNSTVREKLADQCKQAGVGFVTVRAANAVVMDTVELAEGANIAAFVTLTSNIKIGRQFHANIYSYVAHDCVIGDFVTFAPSVKCNGNVVIEDHAYIGTGAILRQGKPGAPLVIGRGAVVGMGAVVTKSVAPGVTVVGNPARPLQKD